MKFEDISIGRNLFFMTRKNENNSSNRTNLRNEK